MRVTKPSGLIVIVNHYKDKKGILYFIKDVDKTYYKKVLERFKKNKYLDLDRIKFIDGH